MLEMDPVTVAAFQKFFASLIEASMSIDKIIKSIPAMDAEKRAATRKNAETRLNDPKTREDARRVIAALDAQADLEAGALLREVRQLPVSKRVIEAFTHLPMTETERRLVQVLLDNPGLSSAGLSDKLGWGGQTWHLHFGEMCKKRESRLWPAEPAVVRSADFYSGILATFSAEDGWAMKPDVAEAFAGMGLKNNPMLR